MSVSSFVFFLHPLDSVFYSGMLVVGMQNYFWMLLMVEPREKIAPWIHPFIHGQAVKTFPDAAAAAEDDADEGSQILKSQKIEDQV